jgi:hypothetical protein
VIHGKDAGKASAETRIDKTEGHAAATRKKINECIHIAKLCHSGKKLKEDLPAPARVFSV